MAKPPTDAKTDDDKDAPAPKAVIRAPVLVCVVPFHAWGQSYNVGDVVDPTKWEGVKENEAETAIQNRMTNGFIKFARPE